MTTHPGLPFHTIGHSTASVDAFIAELRAQSIEQVVDVRSFPRSRTNPQFNSQPFAQRLAEHGIGYIHLPELGGRRSHQPGIDSDINGFWDNRSFHNYADYALSPAFAAGLARLLSIGHARRCVYMCAESVWWRCHRRIITDHLLARGETVRHIIGGNVEDAHLTSGAQVAPDGTVSYPATQPSLFTP